jgi:hypothetical protein
MAGSLIADGAMAMQSNPQSQSANPIAAIAPSRNSAFGPSRNSAIPPSRHAAIPISDQKSAIRSIPILNPSILNPQ